jgi:aspartyl protease family protein
MSHALTSIFALSIFLASTAHAGTIHKCKSASGALLYQEKPCADENKSLSSWGSSSGAPFVMKQGENGHYFVDGTVNNHKLNFVIDTGASLISLPQKFAETAGLQCQRAAMSRTANGISQTCTTTIQTLQFGNFTLKNVEAMIAPNLDQPLMGMNVLKQFKVEQNSGEMRLTPEN